MGGHRRASGGAEEESPKPIIKLLRGRSPLPPQKSPISTDDDAKVVREKKEAAQNIVVSVSALRRSGW